MTTLIPRKSEIDKCSNQFQAQLFSAYTGIPHRGKQEMTYMSHQTDLPECLWFHEQIPDGSVLFFNSL